MSSNGKGKEVADLGLTEKKKYAYRPPRIDAEAYQVAVPDILGQEGKRSSSSSSAAAAAASSTPSAAPVHGHRTRKATGKLSTPKGITLPGEESPDDDKKEPGSSAASVAGSEKDDSSVSFISPSVPLSLRPHQATLQEDLVWDPSCAEPASVDDYLVFVRNIIEFTLGGDSRKVSQRWGLDSKGELQPLESDQQALEFLQLHGGDVAAAQLQLLSELGIKKEHAYIEALDNLCPSGASARGLESRDRSCFMGAFQTGVPGSAASRDRASKYQYNYGRSIVEDVAGESNSGGAASAADRKKRGADRSEIKKMWASLQTKAVAVKARCVENAKTRGGPAHANKVRFRDIHDVIKEAASIPPLESAPGETSSKTLDDALDDLRERAAQARKYIAMVHDALNTSAGELSTLEDLQRLLTSIRGQPILLEEDALLDSVIRDASNWQKKAKELVENLDKGTTSEVEVKTLLHAAKALPVRFDSKTLLESRMAECEVLGREIRAAIPQKSRTVVYQKMDVLRQLHEKVSAVKLTFSEGDYLAKVLKRTERWCAEAKVAVSMSPDLKKLHNLLSEAGSIPVDLSVECAELNGKVDQAAKWVDKVRKALPKKNKTRRTGDVSKVDYTAARTLLSEGAGIGVDMKELEDISGALGTAEEWLARVREALEDATDATSLQALESLLVEADDIPVVMEEHKILSAEIEARKWALKIQPKLDLNKLTPEELVNVIDQASNLRSRLPIAAKDQKNWRIPQEIEARRVLDIVQSWINKYRKCLVNPNSAPLSDRKEGGGRGSSSSSSVMQLKRTVAISTLEELIETSKEIPANIQECVAILQSAVDGAKAWYEAWGDLLEKCNLKPGDNDAMQVDGVPQKGEKMDLHTVTQCVSAGEAVGVELPEVEKLKSLIQRVNAWIEHVGNACPQRLSKRKSRAKATLAEVRQLLDEGAEFGLDVEEEANKVRARLEATAEWQQQCQSDLMQLNQEAEEHLRRFEEALEARKKKAGQEDEDEEIEELLALEEVRIKRLEELKDKAGDVVIATPEERIVSRHVQAHKWFENVAGVLLYDSKEISEDAITEVEEAITKGEKLLGLKEDTKKKPKAKSNKKKVVKREEEDNDEEGGGEEEEATKASTAREDASTADGEGEAPDEESKGRGKRRRKRKTKDSDEEQEEVTPAVERRRKRKNRDEEEEEVVVADAVQDDEGEEQEKEKEQQPQEEEKEEEEEQEEENDEEEEEDEEKPAPEEKTPCEEALDKLLKRWWDKLEDLRRIMDVSRSWRAKASKVIGSEKMKLTLLEELIEDAGGFDFVLEQVKKVTNELEKAKSIQSRALEALEGSTKLELPALKSLIGEGDKCKVQLDEVKALKKHHAAGQKWMQRFEKARDEIAEGASDQLQEMKALAEEAKDLRVDLADELPVVMHIITRCCLCRGYCEGDLMPCTQCGEKYHVKCLQIDGSMADKFICPRCLVRRHFQKAVELAVAILLRWIDPAKPGKASESGSESRDERRNSSSPEDTYLPGGGIHPKMKMKALMKRAVQALKVCTEGGAEEVKKIAKGARGHPVLEVAKLVLDESGTKIVDPVCGHYNDARTLALNFLRIVWASKLLYQLRRRPARNVLYAQLMAMDVYHINDPALHLILSDLYNRATHWVEKLKDLVMRCRLNEDEDLDTDGLKRMLDEKKFIPVMVKEEGRALTVLEDGGLRYCHCKGFYDGSNLVECSSCKNWFHLRCLRLKKEEVVKTSFKLNCQDCCRKKGIKYNHPEYQPPEQELQGDGTEDDDEEDGALALELGRKAETPEMIAADTKSLEGLWPPLDLVVQLEEAVADVDCSPAVFAVPKKKKIPMGGMGGGPPGGLLPPGPPRYLPGGGGGKQDPRYKSGMRHEYSPAFLDHLADPYRGPPDHLPLPPPGWGRYGHEDDHLPSAHYQRPPPGAARPRPPAKKKRPSYDDMEEYDEEDQYGEGEERAEWEEPLRPASKKAKRLPKPSGGRGRPGQLPPDHHESLSLARDKVDELEASFMGLVQGRPQGGKDKMRRRVDPRERMLLSESMMRDMDDRGRGPPPSPPRGGPPHHRHHLPHSHLPSHADSKPVFSRGGYPGGDMPLSRYPGGGVELGGGGGGGGRLPPERSNPYAAPIYHHLPPPPPPPSSAMQFGPRGGGGGGGHRHFPGPGYGGYPDPRHGGGGRMEGGGKVRRLPEKEDYYDDED